MHLVMSFQVTDIPNVLGKLSLGIEDLRILAEFYESGKVGRGL